MLTLGRMNTVVSLFAEDYAMRTPLYAPIFEVDSEGSGWVAFICWEWLLRTSLCHVLHHLCSYNKSRPQSQNTRPLYHITLLLGWSQHIHRHNRRGIGPFPAVVSWTIIGSSTPASYSL